MRILVTGATGFVGRHLVQELGHEHEVIALARRQVFIPGASEVRLVPAIDSTTDWSGLLADVEVVVHLAARVHVMNETSVDPLEAFREVNVRGTRRLAERCAAQGVRRLIFMSSIKVNGEGTSATPFSTHDQPAPVDPYGQSKWEAETELSKISESTSLETVILRPTVIYGLGVKGNIQRMVRLIRSRLPLPLGSVRNRRTMLSIGNLVHWVERAITEEAPPNGPVLIGDPNPVSTRDLVVWLGEGLGARPLLLPIPVRPMEALAKLLGKAALASRLFGDLESMPTFEAFPGVEKALTSVSTELRMLGAQIKASEGHDEQKSSRIREVD